jgi:hypothetical protein
VRDNVKAHLHAAPLRQLRPGQIQFFMPCVAPIWSGDASPRRPSYEEEGNGYYGATVTTLVTVTDTYRCPRCQGGTTVSGQQKTYKQPFCHSAQPR